VRFERHLRRSDSSAAAVHLDHLRGDRHTGGHTHPTTILAFNFRFLSNAFAQISDRVLRTAPLSAE
jgi:hypothetical protein